MRIITYQSPSGQTINLSEEQVLQLEAKNSWPKDSNGQEFCQVSHGWHEGAAVSNEELGLAPKRSVVTSQMWDLG